jgi:opacity protein-like surface antigen
MAQTTHTAFGRQLLAGLVAIAFLGAATEARAQGFISPMFGVDFGGDAGCLHFDSCKDKKTNYSVGFGALGTIIGVEGEVAYAPDFFGASDSLSSSVMTAMGNVLLAPKIGPVRPYALVGVGLMKSHVELTTTSLFTTNDNTFGWDIGGGLMAFLAPHVGIRGDLRYFHSFQDFTVLGYTLPSAKLNYSRASAGIVLTF